MRQHLKTIFSVLGKCDMESVSQKATIEPLVKKTRGAINAKYYANHKTASHRKSFLHSIRKGRIPSQQTCHLHNVDIDDLVLAWRAYIANTTELPSVDKIQKFRGLVADMI